MELDTKEYLDEVSENIRKTGYVSAQIRERIAFSLGATISELKENDTMYVIDSHIDDDPKLLEEEYRRKKAIAPQIQDLVTAIIEMRIDVINLISTGIDKYGVLEELSTSLSTAWKNLCSELLYIDIDRLDRLMGVWHNNAKSFSGLPKKYIDEIRSKSK